MGYEYLKFYDVTIYSSSSFRDELFSFKAQNNLSSKISLDFSHTEMLKSECISAHKILKKTFSKFFHF